MNFETELYQLLSNVKTIIKTQPLCLGGYNGENGGSGGPPAGFIGQLPQGRITYDTTEGEINTTSANPSLVDNLNHIRYRIKLLEDSGAGGLTIKDSGETIASSVGILNFQNLTITNDGGNQVTVSGNSFIHVQDTNTTVEENTKILNFEGFTVTNNGSNKVTVVSNGGSGSDGVPIGSIFPFAGTTAPAKYELCIGTELEETTYEDLASILGYIYGYKIVLVNLDDDWIHLEDLDVYTTGQAVRFYSTGNLPEPLTSTTEYYVRRDGSSIEYTIHPTEQDALDNTNKINLTTEGSGLLTIQKWEYIRIPDMRGKFPIGSGIGTSQTEYILGQRSGEETHALLEEEMPAHTHSYTYKEYSLINEIGVPTGDDNSIPTYLVESSGGDATGYVGNGNPHNNMPPYLVLNYIIKVL